MSELNIQGFHRTSEAFHEINLGGSRAPSKSASLDNTDKSGKSPLFAACEEGDIGTVEQFLRYGANVDQPDHRGRTPLIVSAKNGHVEVVQALLSGDANPWLAANNGSTALHHAASEGSLAIIEALVDHVAASAT